MIPEIKVLLVSAPMLFSNVNTDHILTTVSDTANMYVGEGFDAKMKDVDKIAEAIFFETRGTCNKDKYAVAEVILKRTELDGYPNDVEKVVNQYTWKDGKKICQFSYMCEPSLKHKRKLYRKEPYEWELSRRAAFQSVFFGTTDYTNGADHYYAYKKVKPSWHKNSAVTAKTCAHLYLKLAKG